MSDDDALCERLEEVALAIGWRASLYEAHKHPMPNTARGLRDHEQTVRAAIAAIRRARAEIDDLRISVIAFGGPYAVTYARERGMPSGHLYAGHYDILKRAGARMDSFTRAPDPAAEGE